MIQPIKVGLLSCNHGHARWYYSLNNHPYFEVVGASIANGYHNNVGLEAWPDITQYDSDDELYAAHPDMEAVVIGSDNYSHFRQVKWAVERGLHIFSMKVPTFDMDEYAEMIRMVNEANLVFKIELEMRHHGEVSRIKQLLEEGAIGDVISITGLNTSHNPVWWRPWQANGLESYGKRVKLWPGSDRYRGGALADHPHIFDVVRYILDDDFDEMYSEVGINLRDTEVEEMIPIIGKTKKGIVFSLDPSYANIENKTHRMDAWSWKKYPKTVEVTMTLHGTKGSIIADLYGLWHFQNGGNTNDYTGWVTARKFDLNDLAMQFYHAVRNNEKPTVGLEFHYNTIAAMNAAYESIYTGAPCKVENRYF